MNTFSLRPIKVGRTFPAAWVGVFNHEPSAREVHDKKAKVQRLMREEVKNQVKSRQCSPGFLLVFKWHRNNTDPTEYALEVTTRRDGRHRNGKNQGADSAPTPKTPPPPM